MKATEVTAKQTEARIIARFAEEMQKKEKSKCAIVQHIATDEGYSIAGIIKMLKRNNVYPTKNSTEYDTEETRR